MLTPGGSSRRTNLTLKGFFNADSGHVVAARRHPGSALVAALLILALIALVMVTTSKVMLGSTRSTALFNHANAAAAVAEQGVGEGRHFFSKGILRNLGTNDRTYDSGEYGDGVLDQVIDSGNSTPYRLEPLYRGYTDSNCTVVSPAVPAAALASTLNLRCPYYSLIVQNAVSLDSGAIEIGGDILTDQGDESWLLLPIRKWVDGTLRFELKSVPGGVGQTNAKVNYRLQRDERELCGSSMEGTLEKQRGHLDVSLTIDSSRCPDGLPRYLALQVVGSFEKLANGKKDVYLRISSPEGKPYAIGKGYTTIRAVGFVGETEQAQEYRLQSTYKIISSVVTGPPPPPPGSGPTDPCVVYPGSCVPGGSGGAGSAQPTYAFVPAPTGNAPLVFRGDTETGPLADSGPPDIAAAHTGTTYRTPASRSIGADYPTPPDITLNGFEFTLQFRGQLRQRFIRPLIANFNPAPVGGRTIWVAPGGTGDGSSKGSPLGSIQRAVNSATAGDTIRLAGGDYTERLVINKSGNDDQPIKITHDMDDPVLSRIVYPYGDVLKPSEVTYDGSGNIIKFHGYPLIDLMSSKNIWLNGLVLEGALARSNGGEGSMIRHDWPVDLDGNPMEEKYTANGVHVRHNGQGVRIQNTITYWNGHCGFKDGESMTVEGNLVFWSGVTSRDHGAYFPYSNFLIRGNVFFDLHGYAFHLYSNESQDVPPQPLPNSDVVERNLLVGNGYSGVVLSGQQNTLRHNTFVANNYSGMRFFRAMSQYNLFTNNIVAFNRNQFDGTPEQQNISFTCTSGGPCPQHNSSDYNLVYPERPPADPQYSGPHDVYNDPQFIDAAHGDYRLSPTSPAVGAAKRDGQWSLDQPDMGAFERLDR